MEGITPRPLPKLLAAKVYFDMPKSMLVGLADYLGHELPAGCSLLEALEALISKELALPEKETLDLLCQRLARSTTDTDLNAAILGIDEAAELLEKADVKELETQQKEVLTESAARKSFAKDYRERRLAFAAKAKCKAKAKAKALIKPPKLESRIEQKQARTLIPAGSYIWRGLTRGCWCGHFPPYVRVSRPWGDNETVACMWVARQLWCQYIEANALDDSACTVAGLMAMEL